MILINCYLKNIYILIKEILQKNYIDKITKKVLIKDMSSLSLFKFLRFFLIFILFSFSFFWTNNMSWKAILKIIIIKRGGIIHKIILFW